MTEKRISLNRLSTPVELRDALATDIRIGFSQDPKELPPKYFYDVDGSGIFEKITELPEYYVTRAETAALELVAREIIALGDWNHLVELGSGYSRKTQLLLDAISDTGKPPRYIPFDISESAILSAAETLAAEYPTLNVDAYVGDFLTDDLNVVLDRPETKLIAFLGGTLGNLPEAQRNEFYDRLARALRQGDALLVGVDLIKASSTIEPAYNDSAGVTAEFNKNVLRVIQRELGASLDLSDFRHFAPYVSEKNRIEMRLYLERDATITFSHADIPDYELKEGEYIVTELSQKFTRQSLDSEVGPKQLKVTEFWVDPDNLVALALIRPAT